MGERCPHAGRPTPIQAGRTSARKLHPAHRVGPPPVAEEDLRDDLAAEPPLDERDPEVPVLAAVPHVFVPAADRIDRRPADERRAVHGVAVEQSRKVAALGLPLPALVAEGLEPVRDEGERRVGIQPRHRLLDERREKDVVGVDRAEVLAGRPRHADGCLPPRGHDSRCERPATLPATSRRTRSVRASVEPSSTTQISKSLKVCAVDTGRALPGDKRRG